LLPVQVRSDGAEIAPDYNVPTRAANLATIQIRDFGVSMLDHISHMASEVLYPRGGTGVKVELCFAAFL
jgi:hypothetical protein